MMQLCQQKGVEIIEAEACLDHIHILLSIPPKYKWGALKVVGIVFDDGNCEYISCSGVVDWDIIGMTEVRIYDREDLKKCEIFH